MGRILDLVQKDKYTFNLGITNLLIDMFDADVYVWDSLSIEEDSILLLSKESFCNLVKVAALIDYVGNIMEITSKPSWIYRKELVLDEPFFPGCGEPSLARLRRLVTAPREFASRNVFYDKDIIKPV